jgi:hypothetical protein
VTAWFWISLATPVAAGVITIPVLVRTGRLRGGWEVLAVAIAFGAALLIVLFAWAGQIHD